MDRSTYTTALGLVQGHDGRWRVTVTGSTAVTSLDLSSWGTDIETIRDNIYAFIRLGYLAPPQS